MLLELGLGLREALEEDRDEGDALHVAELELLVHSADPM